MVEIQDVTEDDNQTVRNRRNNDGNEVEVQEGQEAPVEELSFDEQVRIQREQFQPTASEKFMAMAKSLIMRALVVYFIMSFLRGNGSKPGSTNSTSDGQTAPAFAASNVYPNGTEFDLYVYVSEDGNSNKLNFTNGELVWKQEGLIYGDWYGGPNADGTFTQNVEVKLSKKVQNNGTIFIHTFFVPLGYSPFHSPDDSYAYARTVHGVRQLNKFKRRKYHKTQNLLTGETSATPEEQEKARVMTSSIESHWHPNITVNVVTDWTSWTPGHVPSPLNQYVNFIPKENLYQPVMFYNDYWNLGKDYQPINDTTTVLPLTITYQPLSLMKWQLYAAQTMRNQWHQNLLGGAEEEDDDQDALKEAILDTNPYLLGLTFVISVLHSIFEFLAFKNDIQFWNNRKSLEGLSVRSVFFNVFQSVIVLLYVLDNETNFVIKISVGVGLLIEIWKINKVLDIKVDKENPILGIIPRVRFSDKGSYVESDTKVYDQLAFRYLSWALFPLLIGYSVYSLVYFEQKGWYSFVLNLLYGFLLTFGFIMMTPQLFINYKLKSVAHLPWRMMSYKFLNTFIDDIFAFVIKMPTMYRIGTLRDDVIFFIFLYQRWVYRVDHSRVNEFGFTGEELDNKATTAPKVEGDSKSPAIEASGAAPAADNKSPKKSPPKSDAKKSTKQSKKDKKNQ